VFFAEYFALDENSRMSAAQSISEYLEEISKRDSKGRCVYPKEDVAKRLAEEISKRTGFRVGVLVYHDGEIFPKQPVAADQDKFARSTLAALEEQIIALKKITPKEFEVGFRNANGNSLGDQITFRIRFISSNKQRS
jgi:hypothetical protein